MTAHCPGCNGEIDDGVRQATPCPGLWFSVEGAGGGGGSASPHIAARPATRDVEARLADAARRVVEPVIGIIRYGLEYGVRPGAKIGVDSDAVVALAAALDLLATRRDGE